MQEFADVSRGGSVRGEKIWGVISTRTRGLKKSIKETRNISDETSALILSELFREKGSMEL